MRLVFLGSPAEVIAPLDYLLNHAKENGHEIVAVVSQPAKPAGRKMTLTDPPLATYAKDKGLLCLQPEKASDPLFLDTLRSLNVDVMITAAYGKILTKAFLAIPKRGTINIHPSLLPLYRGAIPVPQALLEGQTVTGVTVLFTVEALDAGNIILQKPFEIEAREKADELTLRMFELSGPMLIESLERLKDESFRGEVQDESKVTHCKKILKTDGAIDWTKSAKQLECEFRAYFPWPGTYTERNNVRVVIEDMHAHEGTDLEPGVFIFDKKLKGLRVGTGDGQVIITRLKSAGSKSVDAASYWNGLKAQGTESFRLSLGEEL